jgi:L-threonylcarbamoyladenylate synthase
MVSHSLLNIGAAVAALHAGKVIAYPTEAVFGLGCDPLNEAAVGHILSLKGRSESKGLVLIASEVDQLENWIVFPDTEMAAGVRASWPGHTTWLLPRGSGAPDWICGQYLSVAVRVSAHETCRRLCDAFGGPLVSTSANPEGAAPARSAGEVEMYFGHFISGIVAGPLGRQSGPSEIRDALTGEVIRQRIERETES